jgi:versiconal hemiacetal acetate reductase
LREGTDNYLKAQIRKNESQVDKEIIDRLEEVAKKLGKSMAQVAIAWTLSKKVSPIVGLSKKERIDEAVDAVKIKLSDEDIKYLEEPYQPKRRQGY